MADNTTLNSGSGGDVLRDKDRSGVKTPIIALDLNPAGSESLMSGSMPINDNGGSITVDGTVSVSGVVDVTPASPAANDYLPVRLTDGSSFYSASGGGGGSGTEYTEDAAAASDPVGGMLIARRKDTLSASEVSADGDNIALNATNKGQLHVKLADTVIVDGSGVTQPVSDGGGSLTVDGTVAVTQSGTWNVGTVTTVTTVSTVSTVTAVSDAQVQGKAAHDAAASGNPVLLGAYAKTTAPTDVSADGDAVRLWADLAGRLQVGDGGGTLSIDDGAGSITVDGTVGVSGTVTVDSELTTADLDTGAGTDTRAVVGLALAASGGALLVGSANPMPISDNSGSITVDNAGTFAVQATIASGATSIAKAEDVASADADVGVPAMAVRKATPANTSGTDGDYEMLQVSAGRLWCSATIDTALPAGTALIGKTSASHETGTIYNGTTALTPKFAKIGTSSSGASEVVAAVTSKKIRVLRWRLSANGAVNVKWQSHVTPTDLTGLSYLTQYASAGGAYCPVGIFETISGEALDINLSAAIAVGGELTYIEV